MLRFFALSETPSVTIFTVAAPLRFVTPVRQRLLARKSLMKSLNARRPSTRDATDFFSRGERRN